jgi:hypothetical protein
MVLTQLGRIILIRIYRKGNKSETAHFPMEAICRFNSRHKYDLVKNEVLKLRKEGYLYVKPHPSGRSYGLTAEGWRIAKESEEEIRLSL